MVLTNAQAIQRKVHFVVFSLLLDQTRFLYAENADHADNTDCEAFRKQTEKSFRPVNSVYQIS